MAPSSGGDRGLRLLCTFEKKMMKDLRALAQLGEADLIPLWGRKNGGQSQKQIVQRAFAKDEHAIREGANWCAGVNFDEIGAGCRSRQRADCEAWAKTAGPVGDLREEWAWASHQPAIRRSIYLEPWSVAHHAVHIDLALVQRERFPCELVQHEPFPCPVVQHGPAWTVVSRRHRDSEEAFQLRAQDWDVLFRAWSDHRGDTGGSHFDWSAPSTKEDGATALRMLKSAGKPYSVLFVRLEKGTAAKCSGTPVIWCKESANCRRRRARFGLSVYGQRIAWRHPLIDGEVLPRVWTLDGLPDTINAQDMLPALEQGFKEIALMSHRRTKGSLSLRFRAICLAGDKDLVPLRIKIDDSDPICLWATLAPARPVEARQKPLGKKAVPFVSASKKTSLDAKPSAAAPTEPDEVDDNGKPIPNAKRARGATRQIPLGLERESCLTDGNCAFASVAAELNWIQNKSGNDAFNHLELRARDYPEEFWQVTDGPVRGIRAGGKAVSSRASCVGSGRTVFTCDRASKACTVWTRAPSANPNPVKVPQAVAGVVSARTSTKARASGSMATVFTRAAPCPGGMSLAKTPSVGSLAARRVVKSHLKTKGSRDTAGSEDQDLTGFEDALTAYRRSDVTASSSELRTLDQNGAKVVRSSRWLEGDKYFAACDECPFRVQCKNAAHAAVRHYARYRQCHPGTQRPLLPKTKVQVVEVSRRVPLQWKCPLCAAACIPKKLKATKDAAIRAIAAHRHSVHADVSMGMWRKAKKDAKRARLDNAANRVVQLNRTTAKHIQKIQGKAEVAMFRRPVLVKSQTPMGLKLLTHWRCTASSCYDIYKTFKDVKEHKCPTFNPHGDKALRSLKKDRRSALREHKSKNPFFAGIDASVLRDVYDGAIKEVAGDRLRRRSLCEITLVEIPSDKGYLKFLAVGFYGYATDLTATKDLVQALIRELASFALPWLIIGDFNAERVDCWPAFAQGLARDLDADFEQSVALPATCTGRRRIDWAMANRLWASSVKHRLGVANHLLVEYSFDLSDNTEEKILQQGNVLDVTEAELINDYLSDVAESCLASNFERGLRRSSTKLQGRKKARHRDSTEAKRLWQKLCWDQRRLATDLPAIGDLVLSGSCAVARLTQLVEEVAQRESSLRLERWKRKVATSLKFRTAWVRQKVASHKFLEQAVDEWSDRWQARTLSPGLDSWTADELLRLPLAWWRGLALLWTAILRDGAVPASWKCCKVALLDKTAPGEHRPIALAPVVWRLAMKIVVQRLRPWMSSWLCHFTFGGVFGSSVIDSHALLDYENVEDAVLVSQDLTKFFDSVDLQLLQQALVHYRAPPSFISVILAFYRDASRVLVHKGCPASPMLSALFMNTWGYAVKPHARASTFVDDRLLFGSAQALPALTQAVRTSRDFDRCVQFTCKPTKCLVAAAAVGQEDESHFSPDVVAFAAEVGYELKHRFKVLGLWHVAGQRGQITIDPDLAADIKLLAKCIGMLPGPGSLRAWCPTTSRHYAVSATTWFHALVDTPNVLVLQLLGWSNEPVGSAVLATLRACVRWQFRRPRWLEDISIGFALRPAAEILPGVQAVLRDLGWWLGPRGTSFRRRDGHGQERSFVLGEDSFRLLKQWVEFELASSALQACGRVVKTYHRPEDDRLAQRLSLPRPPAHHVVLAQGHKKFFAQGADKRAFQTALATGCSAWSHFPKANLSIDDARATCMCGKKLPSRPHLGWNCDAVRHLRPGLLPLDRAQERLFAVTTPEAPPPPAVAPMGDYINALQEMIQAAVQQSSHVLLATDGSEKHQLSSFAVVAENVVRTVAGGVPGEDQTAFKAEVVALVLFLEDSYDVYGCCGLSGRFVPPSWPGLQRRVQDLRASLHVHWLLVFVWVPSHDKVSDRFVAPPPFSEAQLRKVNKRADEAAKRIVNRRCAGSTRPAWIASLEAAKRWELQALAGASQIAEAYAHHAQGLR
ncbi:pol [Symbiodinium sp. CCMP2592]|nr:pol [Symbiodinium sp. CCMP2592]